MLEHLNGIDLTDAFVQILLVTRDRELLLEFGLGLMFGVNLVV